MFDYLNCVSAIFYLLPSSPRFVFCMVGFFNQETREQITIRLCDKDIQSLVDTLEKVWPNWHDVPQALARSEDPEIRENAYV